MEPVVRTDRSHYRRDVIHYVERSCRRWGTDTIALFLGSATDGDVAFWDRHFASCERGVFKYVKFRLKENQL